MTKKANIIKAKIIMTKKMNISKNLSSLLLHKESFVLMKFFFCDFCVSTLEMM